MERHLMIEGIMAVLAFIMTIGEISMLSVGYENKTKPSIVAWMMAIAFTSAACIYFMDNLSIMMKIYY